MTTHVDGRPAARLAATFYAVVAAVALVGQTTAAITWLHWPWPIAGIAVAALELGGIALAAWADFRRRLGERAIPARALSGAVAAFAVAFNAVGHPDPRQAAFFAGMSALGYGVWLIQAGARRRDDLRAAGMLPPPPPVYGLGQWVRHFGLTRDARTRALMDPALGLYGSLDAARASRQETKRRKAIANLLKAELKKRGGVAAVALYDHDELAALVSDWTDYPAVAKRLATQLGLDQLTSVDVAESVATDETAEPVEETVEQPPAKGVPKALPRTAKKVATARAKNPAASQDEVARKVGVTVRTVQRHWPVTTPAVEPEPINGAEANSIAVGS